MPDLGEIFRPMPRPPSAQEVWEQKKKLAVAAEKHRLECLFREPEAAQGRTPSSAAGEAVAPTPVNVTGGCLDAAASGSLENASDAKTTEESGCD